ncbi:hypothetical protein Tco_1001634 [Tanacetum coccineum]
MVICDEDGNLTNTTTNVLYKEVLAPAKSGALSRYYRKGCINGAFIAMATLDELRLLIKDQVSANQKQAEAFQEQMLALQTELQATKNLIQIGSSGAVVKLRCSYHVTCA